jgi:hypothetical protein
MKSDRTILFTSDTDWASDFIIGKELELFQTADLPLFFFLTNRTFSIRTDEKCGVGVHPFFSKDSSQAAGGKVDTLDQTIDTVFSFLGECVPNAVAFRSHRYQSSNDINDAAFKLGYKYSSNTCTRQAMIPPYQQASGLVDFPVFFEDGRFLWEHDLMDFRTSPARRAAFDHWFRDNGIYVINIHPMHMAVNTPRFSYMRGIKDSLSREEYARFGEAELSKMRSGGFGIADFVADMIDYIIGQGIAVEGFQTVADSVAKEIASATAIEAKAD